MGLLPPSGIHTCTHTVLHTVHLFAEGLPNHWAADVADRDRPTADPTRPQLTGTCHMRLVSLTVPHCATALALRAHLVECTHTYIHPYRWEGGLPITTIAEIDHRPGFLRTQRFMATSPYLQAVHSQPWVYTGPTPAQPPAPYSVRGWPENVVSGAANLKLQLSGLWDSSPPLAYTHAHAQFRTLCIYLPRVCLITGLPMWPTETGRPRT